MSNNISTRVGVIIISAVILFFAAMAFMVYKSAIVEQASLDSGIAVSHGNSCKPKAFVGEAKIKAWYITENSGKMIQIADEDISKLPDNRGKIKNKIQVIDVTPEIEKKLQQSSEKTPQALTITGFAVPCNGSIALASIGYKDGIFRPYLR